MGTIFGQVKIEDLLQKMHIEAVEMFTQNQDIRGSLTTKPDLLVDPYQAKNAIKAPDEKIDKQVGQQVGVDQFLR